MKKTYQPRFTAVQLAEVSKLIYGPEGPKVYETRDGLVSDGEGSIWWLGAEGPRKVTVASDRKNLASHPGVYSIAKPKLSVFGCLPGYCCYDEAAYREEHGLSGSFHVPSGYTVTTVIE